MRTIYQGTSQIHSYSISDIVLYYFIVALIQTVSSTHFEGWRIEEIKNGKIDGYLLRPFSYLKEIVITDMAKRMFSLLIFLPIYFAFFSFTQLSVPVTLPTIQLGSLFFFLLLLGFAYIVELCIGLIIVLLGFWFEGSQGLEHFKWIVITLLSGSMIPLEFLPPWLKEITVKLPFQYMYSIPISILQGRYVFKLSDASVIGVSTLFLLSSVSFLWKRAMYRYASSGG